MLAKINLPSLRGIFPEYTLQNKAKSKRKPLLTSQNNLCVLTPDLYCVFTRTAVTSLEFSVRHVGGRVGNLAFLRPNNSILAFLFLVWP